MKLIKMSSPGWEREFQMEEELKAELYSWICKDCKEGYEDEYEDDLIFKSLSINIDSSLYEMLSTACGCEFGIED
jgi:hypothetical protein